MTTEKNVYEKVSEHLKDVCALSDFDCTKCPFSPKFGQCAISICTDALYSASINSPQH